MKKILTILSQMQVRKVMLTLPLLMLALGLFAQTARIVGKITDESGEGLPGVSVQVKGTTNGAVTDIDGNYTVNAPREATLVFSYTGYETQEIVIGAQNAINVSLQPSANSLSEVIVTGYGSQSRRDITGSVAVVDTKDMLKTAGSNFAEQLQGKVAGVQISTSGDPGSASFVRIRGYGSINNNEPLYVIDGVPVSSEANMNFLNPNDIESMQVLKDASAASIYGARAANGVILITTKKGRVGKSKISLDYWTGSQSPTKRPDLADPNELLTIVQGLSAGAGQPFNNPLYVNNNGNWQLPDFIIRGGGFSGGVAAGDTKADPSRYFLTSDPTGLADNNYLIQQANKEGTVWFDELFNSAPVSNYQISAQGGNEGGNYFISGNYYDHQGILYKNDYKRYQVRANSQYRVKKNVRVGQNLNVAYQTGRAGQGNPSEGSALINSYRMPGLVPVRDIKGYYGGGYGSGSNAGNPIAQQERAFENLSHNMRVFGSVYAEVDFLKHFTFKSTFGTDYYTGRGKYYTYRNFEATEVNSANALSEDQFTNTNWVFFNTLRFNKEFGDGIKFDALVGQEARRNHYIGFNARGSRLEFGDDPFYRTLGNVNSKTYALGGYEGINTKQSLIGNVNFNIFDKYLISATVRRDGSSRFLNNRYGVFPGVSLGWRLSNENFLKNNAAITDLKLRAGYGVTGNDEATSDYPGYSNFGASPGTSSYDITGSGNSVVPGFEQNSTGNPDLKWETTTMLNLGVDLTLFRKFDVIAEWYDRRTDDMIYGVELPFTAPSAGQLNQNIGSMRNRGVDLQLNYRGKAGRDFTYTAGITLSHYKNTVLALDANSNTFVRSGGSRIGDITYTRDSFAIGQFYGYIVDGLWQSEEEINNTLFESRGDARVGRFKYRDLNGDGQITSADETFIGSPHPDLIYGINLTANYKAFDFTVYLQGVYGNEIFNYVKYFSHTPAFQANYSREMLYEAGKSLPVLDGTDNYSNQRNSFYVEDGSYFRARNIQLGYSLPAATISKIGLERFRIYAQVQNAFTFTKYSGLDPDVTVDNIQQGFVSQRDYSLGIDRGRYPMARTFIVGANIEF